ncbi:MAG: right-handed parallel beta-helix repeat-containing protein [Saprospiraceae bacterium]|nr:right-handed parallel beta-helix repeat-containing protein [Saprospiraceae bacterium]
MNRFSLFLLLYPLAQLQAATLHVGAGQTYPTLPAAVNAVQPGDTIEIHAGAYSGGLFFANLKGTAAQWITIRGAAGATVLFEGGTNAVQLTDPAYLHFKNLTFQHQTGNGLNTDDGGSYATPAHHIIFENCTFRDMAASGNNDLLKLSGLDDFEVRQCTFLNGAGGGSGIDMVGCHRGVIRGNSFENMGSNAIQAKGGTEHIRIEGNFFKNCGQRTLNLGGSTGLEFFRPDTAHFEAANLQVYANLIVGSVAAVAYVGSVNVELVNNTIYLPERWVLRILQETVDPDRFLACGDNFFENNIVVRDAGLSTETNIGPNTRPETFTFSNNLWFHTGNPNWSGPSIPVTETNGIINQNPQLPDPANGNCQIPQGSPAVGAGLEVPEPMLDFYRQAYAVPRSIGAVEGMPVSGVQHAMTDVNWEVFPNPAIGRFGIRLELPGKTPLQIDLFDSSGRWCTQIFSGELPGGRHVLPVSARLNSGVFLLRLSTAQKTWTKKVVFAN